MKKQKKRLEFCDKIIQMEFEDKFLEGKRIFLIDEQELILHSIQILN